MPGSNEIVSTITFAWEVELFKMTKLKHKQNNTGLVIGVGSSAE
jgi:hypothetical protein